MGIFSFLNRDQDLADYIPAPVTPAPEETGPGLPEMCREMPIEVVEKTGRVLNTGLITEHGGTEFTMGRHPGGLSFKVCEPGSTVYVRGCDNKMNQFYLRATVEESTRILMKLKDLEPEVHENQRDTFRLAVNNVPISIYYFNDERFERPEECKLVDISGGGLRFVGDYPYEPNSLIYCQYSLDMGEKKKDYSLMAKILVSIEVENKPGSYEHRAQYINIDTSEREEIIRFIFEEERKRRKREKGL